MQSVIALPTHFSNINKTILPQVIKLPIRKKKCHQTFQSKIIQVIARAHNQVQLLPFSFNKHPLNHPYNHAKLQIIPPNYHNQLLFSLIVSLGMQLNPFLSYFVIFMTLKLPKIMLLCLFSPCTSSKICIYIFEELQGHHAFLMTQSPTSLPYIMSFKKG